MQSRAARLAWFGCLACTATALAQESIAPSAQSPKPAIPPGLPRYDMDVSIDPSRRLVEAERATFTNRTRSPATELVFHVYPRYKMPESDRAILSKTLEMLRLSPEEAMDVEGRRLEVLATRIDGKPVHHRFDPDLDTILIVPLARPLPPGTSITAEIDFRLDLPDKWGRWGHHQGVTFLANWYPVLAHHDENGWERTPFVPWHQPWHQEPGHYRVRLELPDDQILASTGKVTARTKLGKDRQILTIDAAPARDFALSCSNRFRAWERA